MQACVKWRAYKGVRVRGFGRYKLNGSQSKLSLGPQGKIIGDSAENWQPWHLQHITDVSFINCRPKLSFLHLKQSFVSDITVVVKAVIFTKTRFPLLFTTMTEYEIV